MSAFELRSRLTDVLLGGASLADFDAWLTGAAWDTSGVSLDALDLAGNVSLLIDEYTSGAWTRDELNAQLRSAATSAVVTWGDGPASYITTGSTNSFILERDLALTRQG